MTQEPPLWLVEASEWAIIFQALTTVLAFVAGYGVRGWRERKRNEEE